MSEETKRIYCNSCKRLTIHLLGNNYRKSDTFVCEDGYEIITSETWTIWECRGCKDISVEKNHYCSEFLEQRPSEYYPKRNREVLTQKKYKKIPERINELYLEVINSYNNSSYILCSIGRRALLESVLVDKGMRNGRLQTKIDNCNYIPQNIRNNIHGFRFLGNNAAHELFKPCIRLRL